MRIFEKAKSDRHFILSCLSAPLSSECKWHERRYYTKALRKTEFSELFVFASFGIVRFSKFGNFSEISGLFKLSKILRK